MKLVPVYDKDGGVVLYDIYAGTVWLGSRRTELQCREEFARWRKSP